MIDVELGALAASFTRMYWILVAANKSGHIDWRQMRALLGVSAELQALSIRLVKDGLGDWTKVTHPPEEQQQTSLF